MLRNERFQKMQKSSSKKPACSHRAHTQGLHSLTTRAAAQFHSRSVRRAETMSEDDASAPLIGLLVCLVGGVIVAAGITCAHHYRKQRQLAAQQRARAANQPEFLHLVFPHILETPGQLNMQPQALPPAPPDASAGPRTAQDSATHDPTENSWMTAAELFEYTTGKRAQWAGERDTEDEDADLECSAEISVAVELVGSGAVEDAADDDDPVGWCELPPPAPLSVGVDDAPEDETVPVAVDVLENIRAEAALRADDELMPLEEVDTALVDATGLRNPMSDADVRTQSLHSSCTASTAHSGRRKRRHRRRHRSPGADEDGEFGTASSPDIASPPDERSATAQVGGGGSGRRYLTDRGSGSCRRWFGASEGGRVGLWSSRATGEQPGGASSCRRWLDERGGASPRVGPRRLADLEA